MDSQRRTVALLHGLGVPPEEIAREVGCGYSTLRRRFAAEPAHGRGALMLESGLAWRSGRCRATSLPRLIVDPIEAGEASQPLPPPLVFGPGQQA